METHLAERFRDTPEGIEAETILRKCVHCGFCTATCPTYQVMGDERDGPRGRIYLMKQVLEGKPATLATLTHLDRCLTCRNCESTCPSGVKYSHLLDIGRKIVEDSVERPLAQRVARKGLVWLVDQRTLFEGLMKTARSMRPVLPAAIKAKVPVAREAGDWPTTAHAEKVLMLNGCVQGAMLPGVDRATARVLDRLGVGVIIDPASGCCGSLKFHLNEQDRALAEMKRNIDVWWPYIESGRVHAILMNASGCGAMLKEYGHVLRNDPVYAERAARVSEITVDAIEWLTKRLGDRKPAAPLRTQKLVFHPPCTLQHAQKIRGEVEKLLTTWGAELLPFNEPHLCCGSGGVNSVLEPAIGRQLRARKLGHLQANRPEVILSANVGCISHLAGGTDTPVMHWIEWIETRLAAA
ncbi:MAG: glycolate oxidase subunit GlcF [Lautropia sp.]|nr:glycolate oxidase subunit GlcF [Lautropia sp.]